MMEWVFPVVGATVVFLVAVPLLTLLAWLACVAWPSSGDDLSTRGSPVRFAVIAGPSLAPVLWLLSATVHQSEERPSLSTCVVDHLGSELCRDVALFGMLLLGVLGWGVLQRVRGAREDARATPLRDVAQTRRVARLCSTHPELAGFGEKVRLVRGGAAEACTRGWLMPRIELSDSLLGRLTDDEVLATLLHEAEHVRAHDPLRFFVAQVALSINPLRGLLVAELARHHFAREALCDRRAVLRGAEPLALARSIVSVARSGAPPVGVAALGGPGVGGVRVRIHLLLGYAVRRPASGDCTLRRVGFIACAALLLVGPHMLGAGALDAFHLGIERAALSLGLG